MADEENQLLRSNRYHHAARAPAGPRRETAASCGEDARVVEAFLFLGEALLELVRQLDVAERLSVGFCELVRHGLSGVSSRVRVCMR